MAVTADQLTVKIFADGADRAGMLKAAGNPLVKGFTTNPTLMRRAGIAHYEAFAREILRAIPDRPISFEVFSDDFDEMYAQSLAIAEWGRNVYVKIPITDTKGQSAIPLLRRLARAGVQINATAVLTLAQIQAASDALAEAAPCAISVFAGRIADAGVDPLPIMRRALEVMRPRPHQELIWASPREVYNVVQAHDIGCHIITVTADIIAKLATLGKDLTQFSLETVRMFRSDAVAAGFTLGASRENRLHEESAPRAGRHARNPPHPPLGSALA
jgi:transaldolase